MRTFPKLAQSHNKKLVEVTNTEELLEYQEFNTASGLCLNVKKDNIVNRVRASSFFKFYSNLEGPCSF